MNSSFPQGPHRPTARAAEAAVAREPARSRRAFAARLAAYARLIRLDKPVGIALLLWPTLDALWLAAGGRPGWRLVAIFFAGTVLMRSAGCAINDVADRHVDGQVRRTAARPLAVGAIAPAEALAVAAALAAAAALLLPLLHPAVTPLALLALVISGSYPYFKRFFPLPQAFLGIAFSFGIPMAYAAVRGQVPATAWMLFAANLFWVIAYDTEYAMVDRADDLRIGIRSSAIWFGRADVAAVGACYALYLAGLAWVAFEAGRSWPFVLGWSAAAATALMHVAWIRGRDPQRCFRAFRHNQWLGLLVFAGLVADYLLPR
jgi:4-hydroxybenzoate polyprenyltransferase